MVYHSTEDELRKNNNALSDETTTLTIGIHHTLYIEAVCKGNIQFRKYT